MEYTDAIRIPMLAAVSVDETTSDPVPLNNSRGAYHSVHFADGTTSGVVTIETAPSRDYAGTWKEEATFSAADALIEDLWLEGTGGFVRHRISTVVAGGATPSVSTWIRRRMGG